MNSFSNKRRNDRSVESNAFKAVDNDSNTADITLRHNFNRSILDLDLKVKDVLLIPSCMK